MSLKTRSSRCLGKCRRLRVKFLQNLIPKKLNPSQRRSLSRETGANASRVANFLGAIIFFALIVVVILTAIPYGSVEPWAQAIFQCSIFALGTLWAIQGFTAGSRRVSNLQLFFPLMALAAYAIFQGLSWSQGEVASVNVVNAISADPFESWWFALRVAALTLAGILATRFTSTITRLKILIHALIALALVCGVFGILRQSMQHDQGFLLPALRYGGGFAQFINKNHFAFLIEPAIGLLLGITLLREHHRQHLLVYAAAIILLWVALVMSRSRGGLLAVTAQMIFAALLFIYSQQRSRQKHHQRRSWIYSLGVTAATTVLLVVAIVGGVVWLGGDQLTTGIQTAALEINSPINHEGANRRDIWKATWRMARAHPILGAGLGGFWAEVPVYHDASGVETPVQAHNDYLELWASAGVVGVGLFVWFMIALVKRVRWFMATLSGFQRAAALGALVGIVGVGVHSLVDFGLHITADALVFMMLLAILSLDKLNNETHRKRIKPRRSDNVQSEVYLTQAQGASS